MNARPLSPHLQIYRLPLTAILSITHRITGVFLLLGMVFLVILLMAVADGVKEFTSLQSFLTSWVGRLALWAWLSALFFHLTHGVRHLIWDTGQGLSKETLGRDAGMEIIVTLALAGLCFGSTFV
jgi:succinate dehydrogenase / fumarate reductase, cytochrome b subunit